MKITEKLFSFYVHKTILKFKQTDVDESFLKKGKKKKKETQRASFFPCRIKVKLKPSVEVHLENGNIESKHLKKRSLGIDLM